MIPDKHKVRVLKEHTGDEGGSSECFRWDGLIGLFLNTYKGGLHHEYRAADGTNRGSSTRWAHIGCNTPSCEFDAVVSMQWLENVISEELHEV